MKHTLARTKIHRATVTGGSLEYQGSISIGRNLLRASGLLPFELVHINNLSNAAHWETYVIPGEDNQIILNGAPSRLFAVGDQVVILAFTEVMTEDINDFAQTVVFVDLKNNVTRVEHKEMKDYL